MLPVGGYLPHSFIDYPGYIVAVVFTQGCNFRCSYCHNPSLVERHSQQYKSAMTFPDMFDRIRRNTRFLDGVVMTGGEPSIHAALPDALLCFKKLGLLVKLDTNGTYPEVLEGLIAERLVDAVAIDIKAPLHPERYSEVAGVSCSSGMIDAIRRSCELLMASGVDTTFRSTPLKGIHRVEDILEMSGSVGQPLVLQRFMPECTLGAVDASPFSRQELLSISQKY